MGNAPSALTIITMNLFMSNLMIVGGICHAEYMLSVIVACHYIVATGSVRLVICAAKEWASLSFLYYEITVFAFVAFQYGQVSSTDVVGHEVAKLWLVGTYPKP